MKKVLKISSVVLLSFVLLLTISAVMLTYFLDPNKFKGKISQRFFAKTGQVLVINGDLKWSIFPWVGIKAHNLTYYNPPGFQPKVFASAKEMDVKIKLIPLLQRKIEVGNITFDHLLMNLVKNQSGKPNWANLTNTSKKENAPSNPENNHSAALATMTISSFKIKDGTIHWEDQQAHQKYTLANVNLNSRGIAFNQSFPASLQFVALDTNSQPIADVNLSSKVTIASDQQQYVLQKIKLQGNLFDKQYANGKIDFSSDADVTLDLQKQTLSSQTDFSLGNLTGSALVNGVQISKNPAFKGDIKLDAFSLKTFMNKLGKTAPAIDQVGLKTEISLHNSILKLNQIKLKADDSDINGQASIQLKNKSADFNLTTSEFDVNKFLNANGDANANSSTTAQTANTDLPQNITGAKKSNNAWRARGNLQVGKLLVKKFVLTNVTAALSYQNDIIELSPIHADLYRGEMNGNIVIDKRDNQKTFYTMKQFLNNVDLKEMLQQVADSEKLSGIANVTTTLSSVTTPSSSFLAGLNGNLQLLVKNGTLQGIDVTYQISRAHSFLKHFERTKIENTKETQFKELTASAVINNGVLDNKDLIISSDYLKVNGQGSLNLGKNDISYYLKASARPKLAEDNQLEKEIITYEIPIKVTGNLSKPNVNLDFAELTKILYQRQIQKPLQDHVGKNIENLKDNLKAKIKDKLPLNILDKL